MTIGDKVLSRTALLRIGNQVSPSDTRARHPLAARYKAGPVRREHLRKLMNKASRTVPLAATTETVEGVYDHDPRSFWGLSRLDDSGVHPPAGVTALLLLSAAGRARLLDGTLDFADPPAGTLADPGGCPAAIYVWLMFAPGVISGALFALFEHMNEAPYADADIYWRPLTEAGSRLTRPFGFELVESDPRLKNLFVLRRRPLDGDGSTGASAAKGSMTSFAQARGHIESEAGAR